MRPRSKRSIRRGTTLIETVLTFMSFVFLSLGMIDLGAATFQNHIVTEAARQGARIASVHGSLAPSGWNGGPWGTTAYSGSGNSTGSSNVIATTMNSAGIFTGLNAANVTIAVSWPDGGNVAQSGNHVQVTVSTTWTPLLGTLFGSSARTLSATSKMPIAH